MFCKPLDEGSSIVSSKIFLGFLFTVSSRPQVDNFCNFWAEPMLGYPLGTLKIFFQYFFVKYGSSNNQILRNNSNCKGKMLILDIPGVSLNKFGTKFWGQRPVKINSCDIEVGQILTLRFPWDKNLGYILTWAVLWIVY